MAIEVDRETVNRLYWRSRRGMTELELRLLPFFRDRFETLSPQLQTAYARLIELEDPELFDWLQGRGRPDDPDMCTVIEQIRTHR